MELAVQAAVLCVVAALLSLVVRRGSPESALLLTLGATAVVVLSLAGSLESLMEFLGRLIEESGLSRELFVPLYKTVGIALVVKLGSSLCRDAGESALSSVVETAGAVCALLAALPLLRAVLALLLELMQ
ncbi:MAG: stage III sporulation protein AD [Oscillibacter sp.]|nr:stage III sporulation protein AD [Oscillibacter sp.]MCI9001882.1 stage III sporulation protein AD [Oscillibacter sp.]